MFPVVVWLRFHCMCIHMSHVSHIILSWIHVPYLHIILSWGRDILLLPCHAMMNQDPSTQVFSVESFSWWSHLEDYHMYLLMMMRIVLVGAHMISRECGWSLYCRFLTLLMAILCLEVVLQKHGCMVTATDCIWGLLAYVVSALLFSDHIIEFESLMILFIMMYVHCWCWIKKVFVDAIYMLCHMIGSYD